MRSEFFLKMVHGCHAVESRFRNGTVKTRFCTVYRGFETVKRLLFMTTAAAVNI